MLLATNKKCTLYIQSNNENNWKLVTIVLAFNAQHLITALLNPYSFYFSKHFLDKIDYPTYTYSLKMYKKIINMAFQDKYFLALQVFLTRSGSLLYQKKPLLEIKKGVNWHFFQLSVLRAKTQPMLSQQLWRHFGNQFQIRRLLLNRIAIIFYF